jgi:hypothetical protein
MPASRPRVFYLHYHREELAKRVASLRAAGISVVGHWSTALAPKVPRDLPDAFVISLDRLPSHGRALAEWVWEAKKRQHIPIVFEGGTPDKVATTRARFPNAEFCATGQAAVVVRRLVAAS